MLTILKKLLVKRKQVINKDRIMNKYKRKITVDKKAGAAYIYIREIKTEAVKNSIPLNTDYILDFDINNELLGIEVLNLDSLDLDMLHEDFDIVYL